MTDTVRSSLDRSRSLRRAEYDRLIAEGWFDEDEHIELLEGALVEMTPQGVSHADIVSRLTMMLAPAVVGRAVVRVQCPLAVSDDSEPEPDIVLVRDYDREQLPTTALLVIEVAVSSLGQDLGIKARLYAAAGVTEYWVIDVEHHAVHVHSEPAGGRYTGKVSLRGGTLALRALPDVRVDISELLGD